jgi:hypothetical protein
MALSRVRLEGSARCGELSPLRKVSGSTSSGTNLTVARRATGCSGRIPILLAGTRPLPGQRSTSACR